MLYVNHKNNCLIKLKNIILHNCTAQRCMHLTKKRLLSLDSWLSEMWQFQINVRNEVTVDARVYDYCISKSFLIISVTDISMGESLYNAFISYGVGSKRCSFYVDNGDATCHDSGTSCTVRIPRFFYKETVSKGIGDCKFKSDYIS